MEPKAIRIVPQQDKPPKTEEIPLDQVLAPPVKKQPVSYEDSLKKMSNRQLAGEIRKGIKGELTGYRAVAESVVLDVILKSFKQGMMPFIR
jgi:hypothetical protein